MNLAVVQIAEQLDDKTAAALPEGRGRGQP